MHAGMVAAGLDMEPRARGSGQGLVYERIPASPTLRTNDEAHGVSPPCEPPNQRSIVPRGVLLTQVGRGMSTSVN